MSDTTTRDPHMTLFGDPPTLKFAAWRLLWGFVAPQNENVGPQKMNPREAMMREQLLQQIHAGPNSMQADPWVGHFKHDVT